RTAQLAEVAEQATHELRLANHEVRYVIGSEVPAAGGAKAGEDHLHVTTPEAAAQTLELSRGAFLAQGLDSAWERVRALVVQPGVEFGDDFVHEYDPAAAAPLSRFIETVPGLVYEAHSTDYQTPAALRALVRDHFAILKVGPALTFALREAAFALAMIENELFSAEERSHLMERLEAAMLANPVHWQRHYRGDERQLALARKYSFSDRIRYYWGEPDVQVAFRQLIANLEGVAPLPLTLLSQYLPEISLEIREGRLARRPLALIQGKIQKVLEDYRLACGQN
ncbi:MAG: class II D-tagatose-bisphosphate aldolase non-catalytic subunit, partial [Anaerolineae bacterium]